MVGGVGRGEGGARVSEFFHIEFKSKKKRIFLGGGGGAG